LESVTTILGARASGVSRQAPGHSLIEAPLLGASARKERAFPGLFKQSLKLSLIVLAALVMALHLCAGRTVSAYVSGPPASHTGAPGESTCIECHNSFGLNSGAGTLSITGLPATYSPNQEITITVTLTHASRARYGFQLTALDSAGKQAGTLVITDSSRMLLTTGFIGVNERSYIEHNLDGTLPAAPSQGRWTFKWIAPAASAGAVTFYAAGNAANGNANSTDDFIYTTSASISPALPAVVSVSGASFSQGGLAPESISSAFGGQLATQLAVVTGDADPNTPGIQLPTSLAGTTVRVRDSENNERLAPLFFVSPGQINYLIPVGTALGTATVTITSGDGTVSTGTLTTDRVSPGIFTATSDGQGLPAALVQRVRGDGSQSFELISQRDAGNNLVPIPIDLGPETDQVFLNLFGTGIRFHSGLSSLTATIGGADAQVIGAVAQGDFVGLDQANVRIPRSLIGRGAVGVVLMVDGKSANTVTISVR
jgi:uncharacterized protein (TIGR03437 family)